MARGRGRGRHPRRRVRHRHGDLHGLGGGADALDGGAGNDALDGGAGDDLLTGGAGADALDGGAGSDTASYAGSAVGVSIDLGLGTAAGGDAAGDTLSSIENVAGSAFADTLTGDAGANSLSGGGGADALDGGAGNDALAGGDGDDLLTGGSGADALDGGAGSDTASYAGAATGVTVDLAAGTASDGDTLAGIENVTGSAFADLSLSDFAFAGPNVITGTADNDSLVGGFGADVISGLGGSDYLAGGEGDDTLYGHSAGVVSLEAETLIGGAGDDLLVGGVGGDVLDGGADNDVLSLGTLGVHTATGGTGFDAFEFITGIDVAVSPDFDPGPAHLVTITDYEPGVDQVRLAVPAFDVLAAAQEQGDDVLIIYSGERGILLQGTQTTELQAGDFVFVPAIHQIGTEGPDVLVGTDAGDTLEGLGGDDRLSALDGDDLVDGGAGNDSLFGGAGHDTLLGGDGDDLLIGRTGDDSMTGDAGADVFGIRIPNSSFPSLNTLDNQGTDTITDFAIGIDVIRFGWTEFAVLPFATQDGTDVRIDYATGSTLILKNTSLGDLDESIFEFDSTPVEDPGLL